MPPPFPFAAPAALTLGSTLIAVPYDAAIQLDEVLHLRQKMGRLLQGKDTHANINYYHIRTVFLK
jgi:hypothetical protein